MKPKISKESVRIIIVLTVIALVCGLIIGSVNLLTFVSDDVRVKNTVEKIYPESTIIEVMDISDYENLDATEIKAAFLAADGAYIILSHSQRAYSADGLDLFVVVKNGKIYRVDGTGHTETPGLGTKALAQDYLKTYYIGKTAEDFSEEGTDIGSEDFIVSWDLENYFLSNSGVSGGVEAVTGATKSSKAVYSAIVAALRYCESLKGGINET